MSAPSLPQNSVRHPRWFRNGLFAINIAGAGLFALLRLASTNEWAGHGSDAAYYLLRSACNLLDILKIASINPVSTQTMARQIPIHLTLATQLLLAITFIAIGAIIVAILQLSGNSAVKTRILAALTLFGAPALCLYFLKSTWPWSSTTAAHDVAPFSPTLLPVFLGELLCLLGLSVINAKRSISVATTSLLLVLHYGFWFFALCPSRSEIFYYSQFSPYTLLLISSLAGTSWLLVSIRQPTFLLRTNERRDYSLWLAVSVIAIGTICLLWLPRRADRLLPNDLSSLVIELSRGPCFGSCPAYSITVHGTGAVEYVGKSNVRTPGTQRTIISVDEVAQILRVLDQANFTSLDDRAFSWCFDSPSVGISVRFPRNQFTVVSDLCFPAMKPRAQAQFLGAAAKVDEILGSSRWVN